MTTMKGFGRKKKIYMESLAELASAWGRYIPINFVILLGKNCLPWEPLYRAPGKPFSKGAV